MGKEEQERASLVKGEEMKENYLDEIKERVGKVSFTEKQLTLLSGLLAKLFLIDGDKEQEKKVIATINDNFTQHITTKQEALYVISQRIDQLKRGLDRLKFEIEIYKINEDTEDKNDQL